MALEKEDYEEPCCAFDARQWRNEPIVDAIDVPRVIEKLDSYLAANDLESAEKHLQYWLATAKEGGDLSGELSLQSECMGFFRKQGREEEAFAAVARTLELVSLLGLEETDVAGTMYLNVATVNENFNYHQEAFEYYQKAQALYQRFLHPKDLRFAGLYNNMALACVGLGNFAEAMDYYQQALNVQEGQLTVLPDVAITYLNMADALVAQLGIEEADEAVNELLSKAQDALDEAQSYLACDGAAGSDVFGASGASTIAPGYYAFVCDKCSYAFDQHGWFLYARSLAKRSQELYAQGQE